MMEMTCGQLRFPVLFLFLPMLQFLPSLSSYRLPQRCSPCTHNFQSPWAQLFEYAASHWARRKGSHGATVMGEWSFRWGCASAELAGGLLGQSSEHKQASPETRAALPLWGAASPGAARTHKCARLRLPHLLSSRPRNDTIHGRWAKWQRCGGLRLCPR